MSLTYPDTAAERAALGQAEAALDGVDLLQADLAANDDARTQIRRQADKAQLRLALHDLKSGLRGMIRVAPLASVFVGVALGVALGKRRSRRAAAIRR